MYILSMSIHYLCIMYTLFKENLLVYQCNKISALIGYWPFKQPQAKWLLCTFPDLNRDSKLTHIV